MTTKKSLNVALGEELINYIEEQIGSGLFNNQSEVVRDALRQHRQSQGLGDSLRRLNELIEAGNEQVRQGKVVSAEASHRRMEAILQKAEANEGSGKKREKAAR
ncbi:MAG: type II toxin-antitoxin system ParD family antitoxin [Candidatus Sericytochromatia bacterium]